MEINEDILFIVLLFKNENLCDRAPYDIEILGKKMWEWVALAGEGAIIKSTTCTAESDVLSLIKPFVGNQKYVFVAYSDTPLLNKAHVMEILDYARAHDVNVLKLQRGYVFNSEYLRNCESIMAMENELFKGEEFQPINNMSQLNEVTNKLQQKILDFHMAGGVQIYDRNSCYIDADVVIEKGVKIQPNNYIKGTSYLGENVVLEPNNVIKDSILSKNVIVRNSYISGSCISENMMVGPFESVINKNV